MSSKISYFYCAKDKIREEQKSNVIYNIKCLGYEEDYINKMFQQLQKCKEFNLLISKCVAGYR